MSFVSIHFLFIFLPAVLFLFYILPFKIWRNSILVLASLLFFGWADPTHLPILIAAVLFNYFFGRLIGLVLSNDRPAAARFFMWTAVIANISMLFFYKYWGSLGHTLGPVFSLKLNIPELVLPLGISYFTFSGISYIMDVYNGTEKAEKNILRFSAYLVMFPKLLQGPITRFKDVKNELSSPRFISENLMTGARRFIIGLVKKVFLADKLAVVANKVFDGNFALIGADIAWYGLLAYTLQIFFDFSGYTDMAIGLGNMLGLKLPENFNFPYISRSITEFWRRWHMSLTAWFRTYVFIPLEFSRKRVKFFRQQSNIIIVFLLTGLWHGAGLNFLIWGGYFGLILAVESGKFGKLLKKIPAVFQHLYALILIMLGWIIFRLPDLSTWGPFFKALAGGNGWTGLENLRSLGILIYLPILLLAAFLSTPVFSDLVRKINQKPGWSRAVTDLLYVGLFLMAVSYLLSNGVTTFIYAQF